MATAARMGVPLSVARGVRLPGEAWSARDWALMQAVEMLDRNRCPGCGHPSWLVFDRAHKGDWSAPPPRRCFACDALAHRRGKYRESPNPESLHFDVSLSPGP